MTTLVENLDASASMASMNSVGTYLAIGKIQLTRSIAERMCSLSFVMIGNMMIVHMATEVVEQVT